MSQFCKEVVVGPEPVVVSWGLALCPRSSASSIRRVMPWCMCPFLKRLLLRFERIQQRHYGMKLLAYTLINLRKSCGI